MRGDGGRMADATGGKVAWWRRMVDMVSNRRLRKSAQALMNETWNPLWNLSGKDAQLIFDYARSGNYAQLQYLFNEIERRDPTLLTCVTRRGAAISELDWKVVRSDERLNRGADDALAQEQIDFLETAMARIENLPDAMEHLGLFAFRGYSHVSPVYGYGGQVERLDLLDSWNFCYDRAQRAWLWNPDATSFTMPRDGCGRLVAIPPDEIVTVTGTTAIDWPGLFIFLRTSIGERDWGRFIETYGLPPVIITMPEFSSEQDQQRYVDAAESVFEGKSGVVPAGSQVNYGSESRGTEPFSAFLEHQQKLVVLMATGGTLTSLAESGSGTLAGNAQADVWRQIVRRDVRRISNAVDRQLCHLLLEREFPGRPKLAEFRLDTTPKPTADEVLDLAGKAASAGFEMDAEELTQATGWTIRRKSEPDGGGFGGGGGGLDGALDGMGGGTPVAGGTPTADDGASAGGSEMAAAVSPAGIGGAETAENAGATSLAAPRTGAVAAETAQDGEGREGGMDALLVASNAAGGRKSGDGAKERLVRSLQQDFRGVADELAKVLALPEGERRAAAQSLLGRLDTLVPDDPAMAEVIAEQMEEAFGAQLRKDAAVANSECRAKDPSSCSVHGTQGESGDGKGTGSGGNTYAGGRNDGKIVFHPGETRSQARGRCPVRQARI